MPSLIRTRRGGPSYYEQYGVNFHSFTIHGVVKQGINRLSFSVVLE